MVDVWISFQYFVAGGPQLASLNLDLLVMAGLGKAETSP